MNKEANEELAKRVREIFEKQKNMRFQGTYYLKMVNDEEYKRLKKKQVKENDKN